MTHIVVQKHSIPKTLDDRAMISFYIAGIHIVHKAQRGHQQNMTYGLERRQIIPYEMMR
jgi:hypothetical protein